MAFEIQQLDAVEETRRRAQDALRRATGPMHVPQPDGSTLRLCYAGRLVRAMSLANEAEGERRGQIEQAINEIATEAEAAWAQVAEAWADHERACGWNGITLEPLTERGCRCAVCNEPAETTIRFISVEES